MSALLLLKAKARAALLVLCVTGAPLVLAGCNANGPGLMPNIKAEAPISPKLVKEMKAKGMSPASPILIRIYKDENILEVWKKNNKGKYAKLTDYEICKWSGKLGPKIREGDRQAPEGFYHVYARQMNPNSSYYLSFNIGYPNQFDRAYGRTGSNLMVHGACSSAGCYSMTDEYVQDIYALARDAFRGGQKSFQVQALPFRMTAANMAKHADNPNFEFWKNLKEGYDYTELTKQPPKVNVCEKRYVFNRNLKNGEDFKPSGTCPETTIRGTLLSAYTKNLEKEQKRFKSALVWTGGAKKYGDLDLANPQVPTIVTGAKGQAIATAAEPPKTEDEKTKTASVPAAKVNQETADQVKEAKEAKPEEKAPQTTVQQGKPVGEAIPDVVSASAGEI